MRLPIYLSALFLVAAGCHHPINPKDTPSLEWRTLDTVFSWYPEKDGDGSFHKDDLLGLQMVGAIDKKNGQFIPDSRLDSSYVSTVTKICNGMLNERLDHRFPKDAEGYFKADLSREFPDPQISMSAYLQEHLPQDKLDSLLQYIHRMPSTSGLHYISKEEAKKKFLEAGNDDFSSVLDSNPLPSSIEIRIKEGFWDRSQLERLKHQIETDNPFTVIEVHLPNMILPNIRDIKKQYCILRFKT